MKLLFDHNLSPALVDRLQDLYPDSNHVYRLGLDQVPDLEIWEYAKQAGFLIVTKDADFSDLSILRGFPPKVIWVRRGNCTTADIEALLRKHFTDVEVLNNDATVGVLTIGGG